MGPNLWAPVYRPECVFIDRQNCCMFSLKVTNLILIGLYLSPSTNNIASQRRSQKTALRKKGLIFAVKTFEVQLN